jgi:hypothetical protein
LFKYDLIQHILNGIDPLEKNMIFIPMLTKDEDGNKKKKDKESNKRDFKLAQCWSRPGTKNKILMDFLEKCNKGNKKRDFRRIKEYFTEIKGFKMYIHEVEDGKDFNKTNRAKYFESASEKVRSNSLIFIDPDIGLETKKSGSNEKYLLYNEVKKLYDKLMSTKSKNSILMIFQYLPRDRSLLECLPSERTNKLRDKLKDCALPLYLSDNEASFLFLTKSDKVREKLAEILGEYIEEYSEFFLRLKASNISSDYI